MTLEKKLGPLSLRIWCLIGNFSANTIGLYGLTRVLNDAGGWPLMIMGGLFTTLFVGLLSIPDTKPDVTPPPKPERHS